MLSRENAKLAKRHIFNEPPTREELARLAKLHPDGVRALIATKGRRYRELQLAGKSLTDDEWLDLLASEPWLLRRPLVTDGRRVVIGYSEEALRDLARH